jgi:CO dehydrogenase/acetyl-CoA synthase beta subunit
VGVVGKSIPDLDGFVVVGLQYAELDPFHSGVPFALRIRAVCVAGRLTANIVSVNLLINNASILQNEGGSHRIKALGVLGWVCVSWIYK